MTHGIRWAVLAATLAVCLGAVAAHANDEDEDEQFLEQQQNENQEQWRNQQKSQHPNEIRERDRRGELMRVPGRSAAELARDGIRPTRERRPAIWVDTGPATDVAGQIEVLDGLLGSQSPAIVDGGETATTSGDVLKGTFTDSDGTGWNYCSGRCTRVTQKIKRAGGSVDKIIRIKKGTCTCSCVLFETTGPKVVKEIEVTSAKGYFNIGQGSPDDYSLRCCEED